MLIKVTDKLNLQEGLFLYITRDKKSNPWVDLSHENIDVSCEFIEHVKLNSIYCMVSTVRSNDIIDFIDEEGNKSNLLDYSKEYESMIKFVINSIINES